MSALFAGGPGFEHKQEDHTIPKLKVYPMTINDLMHGKGILLGAIWVDVLPGAPDTPKWIVPYVPPPPPTLIPLA